jgi:hypothetical protein
MLAFITAHQTHPIHTHTHTHHTQPLSPPPQAQQQLSRLQAAGEAHASNVAARDAFVRETAFKMGISLPGEGQATGTAGTASAAGSLGGASLASGAAAAGGSGAGGQQQLPPAALEYFRNELQHRQGRLAAELAGLRETHRSVLCCAVWCVVLCRLLLLLLALKPKPTHSTPAVKQTNTHHTQDVGGCADWADRRCQR